MTRALLMSNTLDAARALSADAGPAVGGLPVKPDPRTLDLFAARPRPRCR